jgi:hypothetical protein
MVLIASYVAFTLATTIWYFVAADRAAPTPDANSGRVHEIASPVLSRSSSKYGGSAVRGSEPAYVGPVSYWVCMAAFANWIALVLFGFWQFLRRV